MQGNQLHLAEFNFEDQNSSRNDPTSTFQTGRFKLVIQVFEALFKNAVWKISIESIGRLQYKRDSHPSVANTSTLWDRGCLKRKKSFRERERGIASIWHVMCRKWMHLVLLLEWNRWQRPRGILVNASRWRTRSVPNILRQERKACSALSLSYFNGSEQQDPKGVKNTRASTIQKRIFPLSSLRYENNNKWKRRHGERESIQGLEGSIPVVPALNFFSAMLLLLALRRRCTAPGALINNARYGHCRDEKSWWWRFSYTAAAAARRRIVAFLIRSTTTTTKKKNPHISKKGPFANTSSRRRPIASPIATVR